MNDEKKGYYLHHMGIKIWKLKKTSISTCTLVLAHDAPKIHAQHNQNWSDNKLFKQNPPLIISNALLPNKTTVFLSDLLNLFITTLGSVENVRRELNCQQILSEISWLELIKCSASVHSKNCYSSILSTLQAMTPPWILICGYSIASLILQRPINHREITTYHGVPLIILDDLTQIMQQPGLKKQIYAFLMEGLLSIDPKIKFKD